MKVKSKNSKVKSGEFQTFYYPFPYRMPPPLRGRMRRLWPYPETRHSGTWSHGARFGDAAPLVGAEFHFLLFTFGFASGGVL